VKENDISLGKYLQRARESKKLTLRAVEKETGISNAYLSQLESGKIKKPSPSILYKLALIYEVTYSDTMELAGYPSIEQPSVDNNYKRIRSRIGPITDDEESALLEYLDFLRSRQQKKG
jgi:transcriptional regulator with XRE-family HTH domain